MVLFVLVLFLSLVCVWTSSLLHIHLLSNSSRSVDRPCHELDRQSLQKKLIYFAFPCLFCCRLFQEVSGWSRCLEICVAQALFVKSFSQMVGAIVLEKVTFSGMRSNSES